MNYDYPWAKYAQISGRDYVSGAMENTTATLHGSDIFRNQDSSSMKINGKILLPTNCFTIGLEIW
jgi:aminopeptidase N